MLLRGVTYKRLLFGLNANSFGLSPTLIVSIMELSLEFITDIVLLFVLATYTRLLFGLSATLLSRLNGKSALIVSIIEKSVELITEIVLSSLLIIYKILLLLLNNSLLGLLSLIFSNAEPSVAFLIETVSPISCKVSV